MNSPVRRVVLIAVLGAVALALFAVPSALAPAPIRRVSLPIVTNQQPSPVGVPGTWHLIFDDEFNGTFLGPQWVTCFTDGDPVAGCGDGPGVQAISWYLPSNVIVSGGFLHLTVNAGPVTGTDGVVYPFSGGLVTTGRLSESDADRFTFAYGYVEARIRIPQSAATFPALWTVVQELDNPAPYPEMDIAEWLSAYQEVVSMRLHNPDSASFGVRRKDPNLAQDFHIYGALWEPGLVVWYVDGVEAGRVTNPQITNRPQYIILGVGVPCMAWTGCARPTTPTALDGIMFEFGSNELA